MKVGEFLERSRRQRVTCGPDDGLEAAAKLLREHGIGAMPVCESGRIRVRDLMTAEVVSCGPQELMQPAQALMRTHGVRHLPVLDGHRLLGIISIRDTLATRLEESRIEINILREFAAAARCLAAERG